MLVVKRMGAWAVAAVVIVASALGTAASAAPGGPAQAPDTGGVVLVHGFRGLVADIRVDGQDVLRGFEPERATDVLTLPAGPHAVEVRASDDPDGEPLLAGEVTVIADARISAVVHEDRSGEPTLSVFRDDVSQVPAGQSRVVVRHTAAAPAIDIALDGEPAATDLGNGDERAAEVAADTYEVSVSEAGSGDELASPEQVPFTEGSANFMYLIGSRQDQSLKWLAQMVDDLGQAPGAVQTGNSGLAEGSGFPLWPAVVLAVVALVALPVAVSRPRRGASTTAE